MTDFSELHRLVVAQGDAWEQFWEKDSVQRKKTDDRFSRIEGDLNQLSKVYADTLLAAQRPGMGSEGKGFTGADHEYKQAFMGWMRTGRESDLQTKSMSSSSDPDGGYTIPKQLDAMLTKYLREMSPMRQLARVVNVDSGDFSMVHSTGGTGYGWLGEIQEPDETGTPGIQEIKPVIGTIYAMPAITQNLLEDNAFDLDNWLIDELCEALGEGEGVSFAGGNGVNKPRGFLTYDTSVSYDGTRENNKLQYVASGASGAFAAVAPADKLVKLAHALKPRYRAGAAWLMNTNTLEQIRVMKNGSGDYLWKQTDQAQQIGATGTLLGYPVYEDENMPDIAANSLSIAFGNFQRGYTIVDRSTRLLRDPYSKKPFTLFFTTRRVGGAVRDTRAIKLMKFSAS